MKGIFRDNKNTISGIICKNEACNQHFPQKFLKNRVILFLRELLEVYYAGKFISLSFKLFSSFRFLCVRRTVM